MEYEYMNMLLYTPSTIYEYYDNVPLLAWLACRFGACSLHAPREARTSPRAPRPRRQLQENAPRAPLPDARRRRRQALGVAPTVAVAAATA